MKPKRGRLVSTDRMETNKESLHNQGETDPQSEAQMLARICDLQTRLDELELQNKVLENAHSDTLLKLRRYAGLYDMSPVGYITYSEKGLILEVNRSAANLLALAPATLLNKPVSNFIVEADRETYDQLNKCLFETGQPQVCEVGLVKKESAPVSVRLDMTSLGDDSGMTTCLLMVSDITERRLHETEIENRNRELNLVVEAGRQLSQTLDLQTIYFSFYQQISAIMKCDNLYIASFDPETRLISARFAIIEGNPMDVNGFPPIPLEPEGQGIQSPVIRSGKARLINDYEEELNKTQTNYFINEDGQVAAQEEIPEDADCTRSALIIPILLKDRVQGVVQIQSYDKNAYSDDDLRIAESIVAQIAVASNNAQLYQDSILEIAERRKAEEKLHAAQVELQRLLTEAEFSQKTLLKLLQDQKESQEQIRQLNHELEQRVADRTALLTAANQELEAFAYSVSHDLRAPLRALDGFSSLLQEDYAGLLDKPGQVYLERIQEASRHMGQLIDDLLNLSRITRTDFNRQQVDLSGLVHVITTELKAQAPMRRVNVDIAANVSVEGDANLLKIALQNLLNNAFKFTGKQEQALIQFGEMDQDGERVFFVRDNGAGFKMEYANQLFIPFQRLHGNREFPGTGIGLSIVQRVITRHGGRIWPESQVDHGTTFYFTLEGSEGLPK